jgi:uncharacterized membrane protein
MTQLIVAALFFLGIHFLVSGTRLRDRVVGRIGEQKFRLAFSLLSIIGLFWLIYAYRRAPYIETWGQLTALKPFVAALMIPAVLFVLIGLTTPSPTVVKGERLLNRDSPATGILRVTRHPFLWGVGLWAFLHVLVNGDAGSLVFFGSLLVLALGGTRSIDVKRRRAFGEQWQRFAALTSNIPFVAIAQKRNTLRLAEIGWWKIVASILLYAVVMHFHRPWFGVSPLT